MSAGRRGPIASIAAIGISGSGVREPLAAVILDPRGTPRGVLIGLMPPTAGVGMPAGAVLIP
jgi:hypothetical protein